MTTEKNSNLIGTTVCHCRAYSISGPSTCADNPPFETILSLQAWKLLIGAGSGFMHGVDREYRTGTVDLTRIAVYYSFD